MHDYRITYWLGAVIVKVVEVWAYSEDNAAERAREKELQPLLWTHSRTRRLNEEAARI